IGKLRSRVVLRGLPDYRFDLQETEEMLKNHFSVSTTSVFEFSDPAEITAAGAVLHYVRENVKQEISHVRWVKQKVDEDVLVIDTATRQHLELTRNQADGGKQATLLGVLDYTRTAMGRRLLVKNIHNPGRNIEKIDRRLDRVSYFYDEVEFLHRVREGLSRVQDIERLVSKLSVGKGNARDLLGLKNSLGAAQELRRLIAHTNTFGDEVNSIDDFDEVINVIEWAIVEEPPASVKEGGIIKQGYNQELDNYRNTGKQNREWINKYQYQEQKKHGISSLKVKYNKIIGFYIEVTKPNLSLVPSYYIKKQTLVNAERFTTEELEKRQTLLTEAREKANSLEEQIFESICRLILQARDAIYTSSGAVARLDVSQSLAFAARKNNYTRPRLTDENTIDIQGGRHPVIEILGEDRFIENDVSLNNSDRRVMILTGPNMAGKSTYLRQAALIVIMAHMGSFVPASRAVIGTVDRVFSRIGATDRLVKGESTFLVEMIETSRILNYATDRSFIIMDEIGRGTSTYDGLAIAWGVLEYLLDQNRVGAKVLFATHYHEITALAEKYGVVNYNVTVKEWNNSIVFLRKIVPGSASKSYGIEVARMAGIPDSVIDRAKSILHMLEGEYGMPLLAGDTDRDSKNKAAEQESHKTNLEPFQLEMFPSSYEILAKELAGVDINTITPLEALNILDRLKKSIE
ncbi:MAG: DNA mismatch repair protein MutS, partial [Spirochaetota bacterium]